MKQDLVAYLKELGMRFGTWAHTVLTLRTTTLIMPEAVAEAIVKGQAERVRTHFVAAAFGASVAANKIRWDTGRTLPGYLFRPSGSGTRRHERACDRSACDWTALARELVHAYLNATFTGEERHRRRLEKVKALEAKYAGTTKVRSQPAQRSEAHR